MSNGNTVPVQPSKAFQTDELGQYSMEGEDRKVRRWGWRRDRVVIMLPRWREDGWPSNGERMRFAADFYRMVAMPLPWYSSDFSVDHAMMLAAEFPHYLFYFDGEQVGV